MACADAADATARARLSARPRAASALAPAVRLASYSRCARARSSGVVGTTWRRPAPVVLELFMVEGEVERRASKCGWDGGEGQKRVG